VKAPWKVYQNYLLDKISLGFGRVDDGVMQFSEGATPAIDAIPKSAT
jgi:hypothetical protein